MKTYRVYSGKNVLVGTVQATSLTAAEWLACEMTGDVCCWVILAS